MEWTRAEFTVSDDPARLDRDVIEPEVQGLRRWMLGTRDAHGLYAELDFAPLKRPETFMERHHPNVYGGA
jgi:hypothetical protein